MEFSFSHSHGFQKMLLLSSSTSLITGLGAGHAGLPDFPPRVFFTSFSVKRKKVFKQLISYRNNIGFGLLQGCSFIMIFYNFIFPNKCIFLLLFFPKLNNTLAKCLVADRCLLSMELLSKFAQGFYFLSR